MNERLRLEYKPFLSDSNDKKAFLAKAISDGLRLWNIKYGDFSLEEQPEEYHHPDFDIYHTKHEVLVDGKAVKLTNSEFEILYLLRINENRVVPYSKIVNTLWGDEDYGSDRAIAIKTRLSSMRRKIWSGENGDRGRKLLVSITKVGVMLKNPETATQIK